MYCPGRFVGKVQVWTNHSSNGMLMGSVSALSPAQSLKRSG